MSGTPHPRPGVVWIAYEVIEHHPAAKPENTGNYLHDSKARPIAVGDILELPGEAGAPAYKVRVQRIRNGQLHVLDLKYDADATEATVPHGKVPTS